MFRSIFFFKQKTAYEVRISGWSSDVCSSDLIADGALDAVPLREDGRDLGNRALARDTREQTRHDIDHQFEASAIAGAADLAGQRLAQPVFGIAARRDREPFLLHDRHEIGRASGMARVCQYV